MSTIVLLPVSLMVVLAGALLFTNAIEWLGGKLEQGAVGSLLAAVATALPESLIPITAIVRGGEGSDEVATGAILGAPFLLATLAMALVGVSAIVWRRRRPQGSDSQSISRRSSATSPSSWGASQSRSYSVSSDCRCGFGSWPPSHSSSRTRLTSA